MKFLILLVFILVLVVINRKIKNSPPIKSNMYVYGKEEGQILVYDGEEEGQILVYDGEEGFGLAVDEKAFNEIIVGVCYEVEYKDFTLKLISYRPVEDSEIIHKLKKDFAQVQIDD